MSIEEVGTTRRDYVGLEDTEFTEKEGIEEMANWMVDTEFRIPV